MIKLYILNTSNGCSTQTANETALHRFAKQTIQEAAYIKLPDLIIKEDLPEIQQMKDEYHYYDCLFPDGIKIIAGASTAAITAMIAITTISSTSENAVLPPTIFLQVFLILLSIFFISPPSFKLKIVKTDLFIIVFILI